MASFPSRSAFPLSTGFVVLVWITLPLLLLPQSKGTQKGLPQPTTLCIVHRTVEPGSTLESLSQNPATVTKPSLIAEALPSEGKHALPDGLSIRRLRPLPFLDVDTREPKGAMANVVPLSALTRNPVHVLPARPRSTPPPVVPSLASHINIEFDSVSSTFKPLAPPLPQLFLTNAPWSVKVSVHYDSRGYVQYAFLDTPESDEALNDAILRSARLTRLTRAPGTPMTGSMFYLCLVGINRDAEENTTTP